MALSKFPALLLLLSVAVEAAASERDDGWWQDEDGLLGSNGTSWDPASPGSWICYSTAGSESLSLCHYVTYLSPSHTHTHTYTPPVQV